MICVALLIVCKLCSPARGGVVIDSRGEIEEEEHSEEQSEGGSTESPRRGLKLLLRPIPVPVGCCALFRPLPGRMLDSFFCRVKPARQVMGVGGLEGAQCLREMTSVRVACSLKSVLFSPCHVLVFCTSDRYVYGGTFLSNWKTTRSLAFLVLRGLSPSEDAPNPNLTLTMHSYILFSTTAVRRYMHYKSASSSLVDMRNRFLNRVVATRKRETCDKPNI